LEWKEFPSFAGMRQILPLSISISKERRPFASTCSDAQRRRQIFPERHVACGFPGTMVLSDPDAQVSPMTQASPQSSILCIDDEPSVRVLLQSALTAMGHRVVLASTFDEGMKAALREPSDLIIADHEMPDGSAMDLLQALRQQGCDTSIIMTSPYTNVEHAVQTMRHGAIDYLTKPLRMEALRLAVHNAIELDRMRRANEDFRREICALRGAGDIVGDGPALRQALEIVARVAPTRATVLVDGESGTGKELLAREIHRLSTRADGPFIAVNCAALPEGLVESTLFGHERGAFTGAVQRRAGAFERAHRGTLLLDEISEMRLDLQAKLLRAIQEQEFERVGGTEPIKVDVRIVATTNRDLLAEVEAGRFRRDLFFRLHVVPIHAPALREHLEDLPALVDHFVAQSAARMGVKRPEVPREAHDRLRARPWPGNVRELANAVERAVILARGGQLDPALLDPPSSPSGRSAATSGEPPQALTREETTLDLRTLEHLTIVRALEATGGHRTRAAHLLGISERTLRNKLNR
jgi:DNA-binding NtrC family response regulator